MLLVGATELLAAFFFGLSYPRANSTIESANVGLNALYLEQFEANPEIKEEEKEVWLGIYQSKIEPITYTTKGLVESKDRMFNVLLFGGLLTFIVALTLPTSKNENQSIEGQPIQPPRD